MIQEFTGEYAFLDNDFPASIPYQGITFPTATHAFTAARSYDMATRRRIAALLTTDEVKTYALKFPLRPDWMEMRIKLMEDICLIKFSYHEELCRKLTDTGDQYLAAGNLADPYWGNPENKLGFVLMRVRDVYTPKIVDPTGFKIPNPKRKA